MQKLFGSLTASCLLLAGLGFSGSSTAAAQDQASGATTPPAVLVINREFLKPGRGGSPHEKAESAFVQTLSQAHSQDHYVGMVSLSGKARALFFHGFDSFADWQKAVGADMANSQLWQNLDNETQADGDLLSSMETGVFVYQPDMSVHAPVDIAHMRFMEITQVRIRPGHEADWKQAIHLYNSIFGNIPNAHWAAYQMLYGDASGLYLFISPMKAVGEVDQFQKGSAQALAAASADQKKQLDDLTASAIESIQSNLFAFDPKMSYPVDSWKAADPQFWGQQ